MAPPHLGGMDAILFFQIAAAVYVGAGAFALTAYSMWRVGKVGISGLPFMLLLVSIAPPAMLVMALLPLR